MAPGVQERWKDLVVSVDDCVGHWQAPGSLLGQARLPIGRVLPSEPDDVPEWLLAHPDVVVTGVDGSGARVAIERGMFDYPLLVDRHNGVLTTADGRMTWRAVELELAPARAANIGAEPPAPRRSGQKGHQRAAARAYIKEAFPDGVPASVSVSAIEAALKARGTPVSARTIRRAMGAARVKAIAASEWLVSRRASWAATPSFQVMTQVVILGCQSRPPALHAGRHHAGAGRLFRRRPLHHRDPGRWRCASAYIFPPCVKER